MTYITNKSGIEKANYNTKHTQFTFGEQGICI